MKKILFLLMLMLTLTACGEKKDEKNETAGLFAETLITQQNAEELLSTSVTKTVDGEGKYSSVKYYPEKVGSVPPIIVELYSEDGETEFKNRREKRPSAKKTDGIGEDAYIAYPSLVFRRSGYMAVVTAGTGGEKAEDMLKKTAEIADKNLREYLDAYPAD